MLDWVGSLRPIVQHQFHVVEIEPFAAVRLQRSGRVAQRFVGVGVDVAAIARISVANVAVGA